MSANIVNKINADLKRHLDGKLNDALQWQKVSRGKSRKCDA